MKSPSVAMGMSDWVLDAWTDASRCISGAENCMRRFLHCCATCCAPVLAAGTQGELLCQSQAKPRTYAEGQRLPGALPNLTFQGSCSSGGVGAVQPRGSFSSCCCCYCCSVWHSPEGYALFVQGETLGHIRLTIQWDCSLLVHAQQLVYSRRENRKGPDTT
jgi:hypothetical protein